MRRSTALFVAFIIVCALLAVAAATSIMDSPQTARLKRLDAKRIQNLRELSNAISAYHGKTRKLPESLRQLAQNQGFDSLALHDEKQRPYVYHVKDAAAYDLCAHFDMEADDDERSFDFPRSTKHPAGDYCFSVTIAP
jgi:hypothetical protein